MECLGGDGYPVVDLDSENSDSVSSEDGMDTFLHQAPECKQKKNNKDDSCYDAPCINDFERDMDEELKDILISMADKLHHAEADTTCSKNDDLFYDPMMDEEDQLWVNGKRQFYQPQKNTTSSMKSSPRMSLPQSDAVLNCPACMSLICLDCQRHEVYKNQYRAMFVMNCVADPSVKLHFPNDKPEPPKKSVRREQLKNRETFCNDSQLLNIAKSTENKIEDSFGTEDEAFHLVKCKICNTEIGVYGLDEVYHFFNVLASHG